MNLRHVAALALVGWYLMVPSPSDVYVVSPISSWETLEVFDLAVDCKATMMLLNGLGAEGVKENYKDFLAGRPPTKQTSFQFENKLNMSGSMQNARCIATDDPRLKEK